MYIYFERTLILRQTFQANSESSKNHWDAKGKTNIKQSLAANEQQAARVDLKIMKQENSLFPAAVSLMCLCQEVKYSSRAISFRSNTNQELSISLEPLNDCRTFSSTNYSTVSVRHLARIHNVPCNSRGSNFQKRPAHKRKYSCYHLG